MSEIGPGLMLVGSEANVGVYSSQLQEVVDLGLLGGWTIIDLAFDKSGNMWCVGTSNNVGRWDGSGWTGSDFDPTFQYNCIAFDGNNNAWAVGTLGNIVQWNGSGWQRAPAALGATNVRMLTFDPSGNLWYVDLNGNVNWSPQNNIGVQLNGTNVTGAAAIAFNDSDPNTAWILFTDSSITTYNVADQVLTTPSVLNSGWTLVSLAWSPAGSPFQSSLDPSNK